MKFFRRTTKKIGSVESRKILRENTKKQIKLSRACKKNKTTEHQKIMLNYWSKGWRRLGRPL